MFRAAANEESTFNPALNRKCLSPSPGASEQRTEEVETVPRGESKSCEKPQITRDRPRTKAGLGASAFPSVGEGEPCLKVSGNSKGTPEVHLAGPVQPPRLAG